MLWSVSMPMQLQRLNHLRLHLLSVWPHLPSSASIWCIFFLVGPLICQLPLRKLHILICILTAVICISKVTLNLCAHKIWEILNVNVISVYASMSLSSESLDHISCSQVKQYCLTVPIEVQWSTSMKINE